MSIIKDALHIILNIRKLKEGNPTLWEKSIQKFEIDDQKSGFGEVPIIFTGSSSIAYWTSLAEDMAPLNVINRGFGGSQIPDVTHYIDRIIVPYRPKGIVFYAGENDITGLFISRKKSAEEVRNSFQKFCEKVNLLYSTIPIYFISIKPPKRRKKYWPEMQKTNLLIEEYCSSIDHLNFINIVDSMLNDDGSVKHDIFKWDGVHLNAEGYKIFIGIVKPVLISAFHTDT